MSFIETEFFQSRDYAVISEFYHSVEIPIWRWITADQFKDRDFVIIKPGVTFLSWSGERSTRTRAEQFSKWMGEMGWEAFIAPTPPQREIKARTVVIRRDVVRAGDRCHPPSNDVGVRRSGPLLKKVLLSGEECE